MGLMRAQPDKPPAHPAKVKEYAGMHKRMPLHLYIWRVLLCGGVWYSSCRYWRSPVWESRKGTAASETALHTAGSGIISPQGAKSLKIKRCYADMHYQKFQKTLTCISSHQHQDSNSTPIRGQKNGACSKY